jgi:four helix bundle protein
MRENVVQQKSKELALRMIQLGRYLTGKANHDTALYILVKQVLRSGTSIGANVRESLSAQSTADFISKLNIALKEGDETKYWLELLHESGYLSDKEFQSIYNDTIEVNSLLTSIILAKKKNIAEEGKQ